MAGEYDWPDFANDIPLGHVSAFDFVRLVIEQNIRPDGRMMKTLLNYQ